MNSQFQKRTSPKCFLWSLLILSLLTVTAAGSLIVLLVSQGHSGFFNDGSFVIQNCSSNYLTQRYANINLINRVSFSGCIISSLISLQMAIILLNSICKHQCNTLKQPLSTPNLKIFFFCGCQALTTIPITGYYFTFFIQLKNCSCNQDFSQIIIIFGISALLLGLTLIMMIFLIKNSRNHKTNQQKYRQIQAQQTEPAQETRLIKNNWKKDLKNVNLSPSKAIRQHQSYNNQKIPDLTNEAILIPQDSYNPDSYPRHIPNRLENTNSYNYSSPIRHDDYKNRTDRVIEGNQSRRSPTRNEEKIISNLHPQFMNIDPLQYVQNEKKKRVEVDLPNQFYIEQQKYLQKANHNQPIMPRGGLQQRSNHYRNNIQRNQEEKRSISNYANINNYPNDHPRYYSPHRNEGIIQNQRQYSSTNQPAHHFRSIRDENEGYHVPQERNQELMRGFNSRQSDNQEHSFQFYQHNQPRRANHYR